ncbi:hypothetical protein OE88DRAFT_1662847 [Heliocybe sulcata]|uniref:Uncharacterized protein n=1 Tax=Heliocybe sulcata TaxID=5364 RepID=A0A5C3MVG1_9AGAM|nr:hypothetical protein OE88DRAFT_1662847 [Heliocybe sulcata]
MSLPIPTHIPFDHVVLPLSPPAREALLPGSGPVAHAAFIRDGCVRVREVSEPLIQLLVDHCNPLTCNSCEAANQIFPANPVAGNFQILRRRGRAVMDGVPRPSAYIGIIGMCPFCIGAATYVPSARLFKVPNISYRIRLVNEGHEADRYVLATFSISTDGCPGHRLSLKVRVIFPFCQRAHGPEIGQYDFKIYRAPAWPYRISSSRNRSPSIR